MKGRLILLWIIVPLLVWTSLAWFMAQSANYLPVRYVRVEGKFQQLSKPLLTSEIKNYLHGGLYNVDVQQVRQVLKSLPWVQDATITRIWPDTVHINITEQIAVARWGNKGLLNAEGQLFQPSNLAQWQALPLLDGADDFAADYLYKMQQMAQDLGKKDMQLNEFIVNQRGAWRIGIVGGVQIKLGTSLPQEKFARFIRTVGLLGKAQMAKISVVDLRYANGYSIAWRDGSQKTNWQRLAGIGSGGY